MDTSKQAKQTAADLTTGAIAHTLFWFSLPFMASTLLQTLYSTVDTIIVGQFLGSQGLSAVSNGSQLMQMLYSLCIGFSNAGQVLIAQSKGASNYKKLEKIIGTLFILEIVLALSIGAICIIFSSQLLTLLGTPEEAFVQARYYLIICGIGMIPTGLYNMFSAALRGMGDSKHPLIFVIIATVINLILDILFITVLHLNVAGAAIATVIGECASVLFCFIFLLSHAQDFGISFNLSMLRIDRQNASQLVAIGIPMAVQMAAVQVSFLFVARMINALGVTVSAVFGVMQKIRSVPNFITQGFALGAASMMGQNLGAKQMNRVNLTVRYCILFTIAVNIIAGLFYLTVPTLCFQIFTQDATVLTYAGMTMLVLAIELPANCILPACNSLVSAQGFVQLSFTVAILDAFVGRILFCWLFGSFFGLGAFGYFLGYVSGTYVTALIVGIYYFSGLWRRRAALV